MIKAMKITFGILLTLGVLTYALLKFLSEPIPTGYPSPEADQIAIYMMESLNMADWVGTDSISWTIQGSRSYDWNIMDHQVLLKWDGHEVLFDHNKGTGQVIDGDNYAQDEVDQLVAEAQEHFDSDSFWLCGPFKVLEYGTERSLVQLKDGRVGLKVTYESGSYQGDTYVWLLDENYRPKSVKLWVSSIPIGGIEFTWDDYQQIESGAWLAQNHWSYGKFNVRVTGIQ
ncbi:hypothetical protein N6H18_18125 [Reichenbachiella agarivorans]|uniref:Uncharacterized protein n=1 Tax=Reichenbachiella agarivorans TaxID=2979464 RepID=A0ABY6CNZ6_9BACT|nr:hypothetical protein [Reichenbachiella agarivorans]UXP32259.1 hypothetical protein N6H18_18125 [Reichenbachiella agarivorans]